MKKFTLFFALLSFCFGFAQNGGDTCGTAVSATSGTAFTGTLITQASAGSEMGTGGDSAFFIFNAPGDGTLYVNSCNGGADTYLNIGTGACGTLAVEGNNDDSCASGLGNNFASEVTIAVIGGTDYIIEWDDRYTSGANAFDWTLMFTPAPTCTEATVDSAIVNADCVGGTFTVDVVVSAIGDAVSYDDGSGPVAITGNFTAGPYNDGDAINITVVHSDAACDVDLGVFTSGCTPANDECLGAEAISCGDTVSGSTLAATDSGDNASNDVWYMLAGTANGEEVTASLCGSDFDTYIRIFDACAGTQVAFNDDASGICSPQSQVTFTSDGATTYYIMVEGYSTNNGNFDLAITCVPPPACIPATFTVANGDNNCPLEEFFIDVDVTALGTATSVNISDDGGVVETAVGIGTYAIGPYSIGNFVNITVEDAAGDTCNATDSITTPTACPPANDECSGAIAVACAGQYIGDTTSANAELDDPGFCGTSAGTGGAVWYSYTGANSNDAGAVAGTDGDEVTLDLSASTFDTKIRVFTGVCGDLTCFGGDDDGGTGTTSLFTFTATVGTEYYILVHGYNANAGPYTLDVSCVAPATCTETVVDSTSIVQDCVNNQFSVDVLVSTIGDGMMITDGVNNYPVVAGTVTAGPFTADGTSVTLDVVHSDAACDFTIGSFDFACPPVNDEVNGAMELIIGDTICEGKTVASNVGATTSVEAGASCGTPEGDVWFKVIVPSTGEVTIEASSSTGINPISDTVMTVYSGVSGSLVEVACDDDGAAGLFSLIELTGLNPGDTLFVRVWEFGDDTKGSFDICAWSPSTLGIEDNIFEGFSYYPNPVKDVLTLKSPISIDNVSVYNIVGQQIININDAKALHNIDMSNFQSGTYIVKVSANNQIKTIRVLKE